MSQQLQCDTGHNIEALEVLDLFNDTFVIKERFLFKVKQRTNEVQGIQNARSNLKFNRTSFPPKTKYGQVLYGPNY